MNTYEKIPEFDQCKQCVVQGEPVATKDESHYPVYVLDLPQQIVDGKETSLPIVLTISKAGTVKLTDLTTAKILVSAVCDKTGIVSITDVVKINTVEITTKTGLK